MPQIPVDPAAQKSVPHSSKSFQERANAMGLLRVLLEDLNFAKKIASGSSPTNVVVGREAMKKLEEDS